jgi:hypothetical protein
LALHVVDEATHDFLSWYNPRALRIRSALGGIPFPPTFSFVPWILGLTVIVLWLAALTPAAYGGRVSLRPIAWILAGVSLANGVVHITASLLNKKLVPGTLSAPLLLLSGGFLAYTTYHLV